MMIMRRRGNRRATGMTPRPHEALVDGLVRDCAAALVAVDGEVFRVARRVAADRVISTVDTEARHGHKSHDRRFDGFKAHISMDPDSEIIDEVVVTPATPMTPPRSMTCSPGTPPTP